jgi:plastocyanin
MKYGRLPLLGMMMLLSLGLSTSLSSAQPAEWLTVPVAFGRGLDTAQPGNAVNHVILPDTIKVKQGGVVHFLVSGFHQVFVYEAGTEPDDIEVPDMGTFIDDLDNLRYEGIEPAGGPLSTPSSDNPDNGSNRVESVSFLEPGTYLVICNVRGHFLDGMFATVQVSR